MISLKAYAAKTHQGPFLTVNEDNYDVDFDNHLYMIFDGFGGAGIGDKVVEDLMKKIKHFYLKVSSSPDSTLPFYYSQKYLLEGNCLINAAYYAHRSLFKENQKVPLGSRGGASSCILSLSENMINIFSIGNCLMYLYRRGDLIKIVEDDSLRFMGRDDFDKYYRTMPLSGFGLFEDLHFSLREVKIQHDDMILFLTDGIFSRIYQNEIRDVISRYGTHLIDKVDYLMNLSNERGNNDNQTALILQFHDERDMLGR